MEAKNLYTFNTNSLAVLLFIFIDTWKFSHCLKSALRPTAETIPLTHSRYTPPPHSRTSFLPKRYHPGWLPESSYFARGLSIRWQQNSRVTIWARMGHTSCATHPPWGVPWGTSHVPQPLGHPEDCCCLGYVWVSAFQGCSHTDFREH